MKIKVRPCPDQMGPNTMLARPERVREYEAEIGGWKRTWKEYVPECYDGKTPVPLVLALHGSNQHTADVRCAWELVAERENFIVLYPHCSPRGWNIWPDYLHAADLPDDIAYIDAIIDIMEEKYNIDTGRIYMQGQSMGDLMTSTYIFKRGERIAAAAPLSGPIGAANYLNEDGSIRQFPAVKLPVIRTHGSEDLGVPDFRVMYAPRPKVKRGERPQLPPKSPPRPEDIPLEMRREKLEAQLLVNNYIWRRRNDCEELPKITVCGKYSCFKYEGEPCDYLFYLVSGGQHVLRLDMAENIWTYFFSNYRRENGEIVRLTPAKRFEYDEGAVALADGSCFAYVNNALVRIDESGPVAAKVLGGTFYVPVRFLERAFPGMEVRLEDEGMTAELQVLDDVMQLSVGNDIAVFNDSLRAIPQVRYVDSNLYVPIGAIAELFFGWRMTEGRGAAYINSVGGEMSFDLAYMLRLLLGTEEQTGPMDWLELEREAIKRPMPF